MPFVVNIVDPLPLLDPFELAMAHYRETAPILRTPASPAPTGNRFGKTEFGAIADPKMTGGAAPHPVQLFQGAQDWQPPRGKATAAAKAPASPAPPPRPLFNDQPGEGERLVVILRSGYEDPKGRLCRNGDVVTLPIAMATKVVQNGAAEYRD